ncbi:long-chain fatty acid--CoA ligase [Pseudomaricurvus alkylphenolicus]|uniref:long-chain fatty acid--CoA ligase n=1 Tax=Pseudomaricurvus alkylphenolicus TaxID=1306991 RepID=UPI0019811843|nr:long-chain fatty acid--CoA ligase [Pseudomaricurvus alkylphenolicus]
MMEEQLLISDILEHAAAVHGQAEIVSRYSHRDIHRYGYADALERTKKLANALSRLGVIEGQCVGTLAWNDHRHFELYYAISGIGAITHTINPRQSSEQISYIINHASDTFIFLDPDFIPLLESIEHQIKGVIGFVVLANRFEMPPTKLPNVWCYEELLQGESETYHWPRFPDSTAASLCYTSGTTGDPKGVLYSHRSTLSHARAVAGGEGWMLDSSSSVLPVVPMFHACAWGIPYSAAMLGSKLVLPGGALDGKSLFELIDSEAVNSMCGVPTVWQGLLRHLDSIGRKLTNVEKVVVGGSAAPLSMIQEFDEKHDVFVMHGWGMTELSPVGAVNCLTPEMKLMPRNERHQLQMKQGKPLFGIKMKIVDDNGMEQPHDGRSFGRLMVKGPWVAKSYFKCTDHSAFSCDGWFDTGDISTIDSSGYMQIVDRAKDVIKSGGEWISSIEIENAALGCDGVTEACVIAATHDKWGERPLLLITVNKLRSEKTVQQHLANVLPKIWLPDAIIIVETLPHNATGKLLKQELRKTYQNYLISDEIA